MDPLTPQQRHKTMSAIRGKNTKPEMIVRKGLWSRGFRYRLNHRDTRDRYCLAKWLMEEGRRQKEEARWKMYEG